MELEEKISHWKELRRDDPQSAEYYWQEIFPDALDRFIEKSDNLSKYRYVISTVGFSPEPIIFFLRAIKPQKALLLYTADSEKHLDLIIQKSGITFSQCDKRRIGSTDVIEVYQGIRDFVKDKPNAEVVIDATGGKKPVVGAAILAGNFLGIDVGYGDYTEYMQDLRLPKPGTEYARILENPLVVFADIEIQKVKEAINSFNYSRAEEILNGLYHSMEDIWMVRTLDGISRCYASLDSFHFKEAEEQIRAYFSLMHRRNFPLVDKSLNFYLNILMILQEQNQEHHHPYLSLHLYFSGHRFANRGRYDMAVFLMYRVIELILGALLEEKYGLDPSSPDYLKTPQLTLEAYHQKLQEVFDKPNLRNLPLRIGLMDQSIFLSILREKVTNFLNLRDLKGIIELRNRSIFTHGLRVLDEEDFTKIHRIARKLLEGYLRTKKLGIVEELREHFEFPKLT